MSVLKQLKKYADMPMEEWPMDFDQRLLECLRSSKLDLETKKLAISLSGSLFVINLEIVEELTKYIERRSESYELSLASIYAVMECIEDVFTEEYGEELDNILLEGGSLPEEEDAIKPEDLKKLLTLLKNIYDNHSEIVELRRAALLALVRGYEQDWLYDEVKKAYYSGDEEWVKCALQCMSFINGFEKEILHELRLKQKDHLYDAIEASQGIHEREFWDCIVAIVSAPPNRECLLAAVSALFCVYYDRDVLQDEISRVQERYGDDDEINNILETMNMILDNMDSSDDDSYDDGDL